MRSVLTIIATLLLVNTNTAHATQPCRRIHGRAIFYTGDGQLRIWHIGTHHTFSPAYFPFSPQDSYGTWEPVVQLLRKGGGKDTEAFDRNALFADFLVCPTEPFQEGATQSATIKHIYHPHIVSRDVAGETPR